MQENKSDIDRLIDDVLAKHAARITPLPWDVRVNRVTIQVRSGDLFVSEQPSGTTNKLADANYIVAAANAAPVLARRLKLALEALEVIASNEPYLKTNSIYEVTEEQLNAANSSMIRQAIARAALAPEVPDDQR